MGCNLLINGIYWGYNPLDILLLALPNTQWDWYMYLLIDHKINHSYIHEGKYKVNIAYIECLGMGGFPPNHSYRPEKKALFPHRNVALGGLGPKVYRPGFFVGFNKNATSQKSNWIESSSFKRHGYVILLMEEILHHLGCVKPRK